MKALSWFELAGSGRFQVSVKDVTPGEEGKARNFSRKFALQFRLYSNLKSRCNLATPCQIAVLQSVSLLVSFTTAFECEGI